MIKHLLDQRMKPISIQYRTLLCSTNWPPCKQRIYFNCSVSKIKHYSSNSIFHFSSYNQKINSSFLNSSFILNIGVFRKGISTSIALFKNEIDIDENEVDKLLSYDENERKLFQECNSELLSVAGLHSVFVIQPYVKWGTGKKRNTTPQLQLQEAVALVQSLHGWKVVDQTTIGLMSFKKKTFFGHGNFENLRKKIRSDQRISAVFISTKMLFQVQLRELHKSFGVPVFDRYTIVIQLFRQHAISREAKLQVAMAEIPYVWTQLKNKDYNIDKRGGGDITTEAYKQVLASRESKIKIMLEKLRNHRKLIRSKRQNLQYPVVAVVGYTNSGKTSLIKALTGDESMQPKNQLFATLDISNHMGLLPSRLKALYVDTIGFISDIPTSLLEPFTATLDDALLADVIVHVTDLSHPDRLAQVENVNSTLRNLNISTDMLKNIIVVGNKIDLIKKNDSPVEDVHLSVSATARIGLDLLRKNIEETILHTTNRTSLVIRVPMGGEEASWLYKEATVTDTEADPENNQYLLMHIIITHTQLSKFKHHFIKMKNN